MKCSTVNVWLGRFIQLSASQLSEQEATSVILLIMLLNTADNNNPDLACSYHGRVGSTKERGWGGVVTGESTFGSRETADQLLRAGMPQRLRSVSDVWFAGEWYSGHEVYIPGKAPVVNQLDWFLKLLSSQLVPALLLLRHLLDNNCTLSHANGKYNQLQQLDLSLGCQSTNLVTQKLTYFAEHS